MSDILSWTSTASAVIKKSLSESAQEEEPGLKAAGDRLLHRKHAEVMKAQV